MSATNAKIYVAGHRGMVGSALSRRLDALGYKNLVTRSRAALDLLDQSAVHDFLREERPDFVFMAAARVGGIQANNTFRGEFIYENLAMQVNVIHGAHLAGVPHLMFLGSSCVYPRECPQPMREDYLLTGPLEPTNEPYAVAKIAGIRQCDAYRQQYGRDYGSVMPTNLYGPNDHYDLETSHVLPALIRKAHEAKVGGDRELVVWGSGKPRREFLFVDDMAEACVFLMQRQLGGEGLPSLINIGCGKDMTIRELAETIMDSVGFEGTIRFDASKPDGMPRKLLDTTLINTLGWRPRTTLRDGLDLSYKDYVARYALNVPSAV
jgi:GDP-L-fucose synthase